ncbi:MAG: methyltransferase domain-containing protein [Acetatifactor sp.]|nr:methyltransferase domain-containing protein [Acetatifactor sp.]
MFTKKVHDKMIYTRRMSRLAELITPLLDDSHSVLDVGCGDGRIDYLIKKNVNISIRGIDVLVRPDTFIEVQEYDGKMIPYDDDSFDAVTVIDVLHHTDEPEKLIAELVRVANKHIIIKDHIKHGFLSYIKLRAMDYVGNAHYHVRLPYNYWTERQWRDCFAKNGLKIDIKITHLNLYTGLFHLLFDRKLHFIVKLSK